jgi:hypothetical protein
MYRLAGEPVEPLGPGSKEKRSSLEALGRYLGIDLTDVPTKRECGRLLAARTRVDWDSLCYSTGDTVTLEGLTRLLEGAVVATGRATVVESRRADIQFGRELTHDHEGVSVPQDSVGLRQNIATYIAQLSEHTESPTGVEPVGQRISSDQVTFDDGAWRTHLASVQDWLHLPHQLEQNSADAFDRSLALALKIEEVEVGLDEIFPRLADRLERAVDLRGQFLESMESAPEGSATLETASQEWATAWDEIEDEETSESGGPIHAEADTWPITEFVQLASDEELELSPSYQRADVWPNSTSQLLIESVLRGIPLPSIIILQRSGDAGVTYEVVDGKQRLTALLRFMGKHPHAAQTVREGAQRWGEDATEMLALFRENYPAYKKKWKAHEATTLSAQVEREFHFPFPLRSGNVPALSGELEAVRGKYYCEIRDVVIDVVGDRKRIASIFEQQSRYKLPVITYTRVTSEQIHEVFSLYNKQGKHLNAEEIRNALYHHLVLMRALLVTAGDSADVATVAPFLKDAWDDLASTSEVLEGYGFGTAGYKRTKVLSWVSSVLVHDEGNPEGRSTATHINAWLKRVAENKKDPLRDEDRVRKLMLLLDHGLDAHALVPPEAWSSTFRNSQRNSRWQELQLVATLVALCAAREVHGGRLDELVEERAPRLLKATESDEWRRPAKTQSREQWLFIGRVVRGMLDIFDVDAASVDESLREQFGASGLGRLVSLHG